MKKDNHEDSKKLEELKRLIKRLRAPDGCPWDQQQKKEDIGKYILEEAYEVVDSLDKENPQAVKEELGDLLFQILFLAELCAETNSFSLSDIMEGVYEKMIRRHPHVFGDKEVTSVREVKETWQQVKKEERRNKNKEDNPFAGIPRVFPALKQAQKITSIASTYGFDWTNQEDVSEKIREEWKELDHAVKKGDHKKIEEELGDLLFSIVNLSRFLAMDAETALSRANEKFQQRFSYVLKQLSSHGISPEQATLSQMDNLWNEAKAKEQK